MDPFGVDKREGSRAGSTVSEKDEMLSTGSGGVSSGSLNPEAEKWARLRAEKKELIRRACDMRDLDALVSYATSEGGLLEDELRQRACEWA